MQSTDIPAKFQIPFANNAGGSYIRSVPQSSQIGIVAGAASLNDGFPPLSFTPVGSGGVPPFGKDMNGILNQISAWSQWQAAGGIALFDSTFSTAIGGYPKGCVLASSVTAGLFWTSLVENNTTNPDGGSPSGWASLIYGNQGATITSSYYSAAYGYEIYSNGKIFQYKNNITFYGEGSQTVVYPINFPTQALSAWSQTIIPSFSGYYDEGTQILGSPGTSSLTLFMQGYGNNANYPVTASLFVMGN